MQTPQEIVRSFLNALNEEDFDTAKSCLSDDVQFIGVLGKRDDAETYIEDMQKMKFKYKVQMIAENGNDVAVFYDIDMGSITTFCAGWYHIAYGKIKTMKVLFDPRPVLEAQKK